jgi:hypothetical protein
MKIRPVIFVHPRDPDVVEAPQAPDFADERDREENEKNEVRPLDPEFLAWLEELL